MTQKRLILIVGGALAVLLVAALIVGGLVLSRLNEPTDDERIATCMEQEGYPLDRPMGDDGTLEGLRAAAEKCGLPEPDVD